MREGSGSTVNRNYCQVSHMKSGLLQVQLNNLDVSKARHRHKLLTFCIRGFSLPALPVWVSVEQDKFVSEIIKAGNQFSGVIAALLN